MNRGTKDEGRSANGFFSIVLLTSSFALVSPDFLEPLPFAVVVAEHMDGVILPQPAMHLREKFAALRFRHLQFKRASGERAVGVQALELRTVNWGFRIADCGLW